ncbi:DNA-formamidopyrimidine glycosylase [Candidatus Saccharibacteria bacterium]|nr:DNA-formamidopyrimidine glycosylase [Candidatus Saccharibacteria bacterium]MBJ58321.1 DNA-formamidopyrimidine glycosylase [Candidatus Saccharibacteria bacterium]MBQ69512.1 DNA-formamidopyrimidine glycosylase [Candidatus Saccharibacteria bacterium]|tara:strand:- start:11405 stop:12274 length:870 start_codon:yes stop_codon:yes gene_type:complete
MPELPEVETVRRGLSALIVGKTIANETHDTEKGFPNAPDDVQAFMIGATVTAVERRAKVLMINLSTDYTLLVHLKMTGQMVYVDPETRFGAGHPNDSLVDALPDRSTRVTIVFSDGAQLFFNDQRKFGWMRLLPTIEVPNIDFMKKVGPEPLAAEFTPEEFAQRFERRQRTNIKAALLDQTIVAGVGNIYADEALWGAKLHPRRLVSSLGANDFHSLYRKLREVMTLAIEKGGSSNHTYVNAEGKRGSYMDFARAFRREGLPCPRCGTTIEKLRVAGRGTHICPHCQVI